MPRKRTNQDADLNCWTLLSWETIVHRGVISQKEVTNGTFKDSWERGETYYVQIFCFVFVVVLNDFFYFIFPINGRLPMLLVFIYPRPRREVFCRLRVHVEPNVEDNSSSLQMFECQACDGIHGLLQPDRKTSILGMLEDISLNGTHKISHIGCKLESNILYFPVDHFLQKFINVIIFLFFLSAVIRSCFVLKHKCHIWTFVSSVA